VLRRLAIARLGVGLVTTVVAACASPPRAAVEPPPPVVAARWIADDGSVVAVNLVVAVGTDPGRIRLLAEREHSQRAGARVIVRIFAATAGPERYVVGHVPTGTEPLIETSSPPSLLGVYDFLP
jgi:hypothetical protein